MLETLNIKHLFIADTNNFFTTEAINQMLRLQQLFVQLVDGSMKKKNPARVLGGGLRVEASNVGAYDDALRLVCKYLFIGYGQLTDRKFPQKFRQNLHTHPLVLSDGFTSPTEWSSRLSLDQILQQFALYALVATLGRYTEIVVGCGTGGWAGANDQFPWLQRIVLPLEGTTAPPTGTSDQMDTTMGGSGMHQCTFCCPRGHPLNQAQAKDARGKGRRDGCSKSVGLEDHIEFCVQLSDQQESLDCNFYLCMACVSGGEGCQPPRVPWPFGPK